MLDISQETEALVQARAAHTGRTPDQILREALSPIGEPARWRAAAEPPPEILTEEELIAAMEAIAVRSAGRPTADARSIDEIVGYDDFGLPR